MSRMLLILVVGGYVLYGITNIMLNKGVTNAESNSTESYSYSQARNIANSTAQMILSKLGNEHTWRVTSPKSISIFGGTADYTVESAKKNNGADPSLIKISVTAKFNDVSKSITVLAKVPTPKSSVPKFMSYALLTQNSISMNGNVKIQDDNNPSWNANVQTNSNFSMNGNNMIKGFLTYAGKIHSNPSWKLNTDIVPNQNPKNLPVYQQTTAVKIPSFNPEIFKDKATVVYNTNKVLNHTNMTLGTKENPKIIYVNGDLNISGNLSGYGVFIVKGNINLSGNVTIDAENPSTSSLGFYTGGNINASGNVTIKAQIFAAQNVNLNGNVKIYGNLSTGGTCNFSGNVNIYYKPAGSELTAPFWKGAANSQTTDTYGFTKKRMDVVSWYE